MNIDILLPTGYRGGVENAINLIFPELIKRNHKVRLIQIVYDGDEWVDDSIEFHFLFTGKGQYNIEQFYKAYALFFEQYGCPDRIIATNWPMTVYIAKMAETMLNKKIPIYAWPHSTILRYKQNGKGGAEYLALADKCLAISDSICDEISRLLPEMNIARVNNPANLNGKHDNSYSKGEYNILFVGRLAEEKGVDVLITALSKVADVWNLIIVGDDEDGSYKNSLKEQAIGLGVENKIEWRGWKSNPWEDLPYIKYLCMPSLFEGFPLTAIEALSNGIPVIATPVSGITELVKIGETGYIIPFGGAEDLAKLLNCDSEGLLPIITPEACKESVEDYDVKNATDLFEREICK